MEKIGKNSQRSTFMRLTLGFGILLLLLVGITSCNFPDIQGLISSNPPTEIPNESLNSPTPQPSATPNIPVLQSKTLIIWVPPQFDPADGSTASNLFLSRLDEFLTRRPQTDIQVRVKDLSGEYGLLEMLRSTRSAAPIIMPNLIALPRPLMEQALEEGLILPLDEITEVMDENDWFDYSQELARVGDQIAGIPFAGDVMVLAYKDDTGDTPPPDWDAVLAIQKALAFPASDPQSLVTMALYQSLGGEFINADGENYIDEDLFLEVLSYYQQSQAANVMPYWITQFETDQQVWQSYQERQSTLAITWSSIYMDSDSPNTALAALPTKDSKAFTYADGWVWCVIPSNAETEQITVELAEYITSETYLSTWSFEGGYIPTRPSGMDSWSEITFFPNLQQLLPSAVLIPNIDLVDELGPEIRDAVVAVLKDQIEPAIALTELLDIIQSP
ncbi:MAG: extracellular solute-binding protein [Anaerolineales bacterium]|nr:extracellular solute-binding protein [Anaerolineales bacterium]